MALREDRAGIRLLQPPLASQPDRRIALMSIRPQFAAAILDGSKRVEFRKRPLAADIGTVVIYATKPVGAVVGEFVVGEQAVGKPEELWVRFAEVAGIDREGFFNYYDGSARAVGIVIGRVDRYDQPRPLSEVHPGARPPQSFKYLPAEIKRSTAPGGHLIRSHSAVGLPVG